MLLVGLSDRYLCCYYIGTIAGRPTSAPPTPSLSPYGSFSSGQTAWKTVFHFPWDTRFSATWKGKSFSLLKFPPLGKTLDF